MKRYGIELDKHIFATKPAFFEERELYIKEVNMKYGIVQEKYENVFLITEQGKRIEFDSEQEANTYIENNALKGFSVKAVPIPEDLKINVSDGIKPKDHPGR